VIVVTVEASEGFQSPPLSFAAIDNVCAELMRKYCGKPHHSPEYCTCEYTSCSSTFYNIFRKEMKPVWQ